MEQISNSRVKASGPNPVRSKAMDNYTDKKPKTGAGSEFDQAKSKSALGSYSTLTYIVIALVLIFGALLLFTNNWGTTSTVPNRSSAVLTA